MRFIACRIFLAAIIIASNVLISKAQFQYISPVPGSKYHNPEQTIILRNGNLLDEVSLMTRHLFKVTGSQSGDHECEIKLVEGKKTIIAKPVIPFAEGETVTVTVRDDIRTSHEDHIKGTSFTFSIREARTTEDRGRIALQMQQMFEQEYGMGDDVRGPSLGGNGGFTTFNILTNTTPDPGQIFWHNFNLYNNLDAHYCIIENNGDSVYGKADSATFNNWDLNHNGYLTAYNKFDSVYEMFDSNYNRIASLECGNGYHADVHECQIYPDKKPYLFAYDPQIVDMTVYNPNYNNHATVIGLIIQQLDSLGNVIFEWRSWDHYNITDCDHVNLALGFIDAVHGNSLEVAADGNIVISARHLSELTKINRTTGAIIWRFGGVNNQFTFINDANKISWQHDARLLPNGNLTVFDNGNYHTPQKTAAKEYKLDEVNKTATLVWSYTRNLGLGNVFSTAMGSMQTLANGHRFICWGLTYSPNAPQITELDSLNNVVWELQMTGGSITIYRARKYSWNPCARPTLSNVKAKKITSNSVKIDWADATNATGYELQYRVTGTQNWKLKKNITKTQKQVKALTPATKYDYQLRSKCDVNSPSAWTFTKTFTTLPQRTGETVSIPELEFNIYPNPAHDLVQVEMDLDDADDVLFTLFDLSGRTVYQTKRYAEAGEKSFSFNIENLAKGMYLAEVKTGNQTQIQKLVVE